MGLADLNTLNGGVKEEFDPRLASDRQERIHDGIHAAFRIPDAMSNFRIRHHRKGGRSFKGTQPHVNILEGESRLQARRVEIGAHVAVMLLQGLDLIKQRKIAQRKKFGGGAEVAVDETINAYIVMSLTFLHIPQESVKAA